MSVGGAILGFGGEWLGRYKAAAAFGFWFRADGPVRCSCPYPASSPPFVLITYPSCLPPLLTLRQLLFLLMFAFAFGRRDIRERIKRAFGKAWDKVAATVGMGTKVSYI